MKQEPPNRFDLLLEQHLLSQALLRATGSMAKSTEPERGLRAVCDSLAESSPHIKLAWMMVGGLDNDLLRPEYAAGLAAAQVAKIQIERVPLKSFCPVREAIGSWEPVTCEIPPGDSLAAAGLHSAVSLPVGKREGGPNGIITIYADIPGYFAAVGIALFAGFIHLADVSLEQAELLSNLSHMANHDLLTGTLNRLGIHECMEKELARCIRRKQRFAVLLFDIDRFKLVNDRLGHQEGDRVLKGAADIARTLLRREDFVGRWGGEEFICVLPGADRNSALGVAERMRKHIAATPIRTSSSELTVTASFGVACYPDDANIIDKLVAAADAALYQAKRTGRNRTVTANAVRYDIYSIGNMLDAALREGRIVCAYQPIVDLASGEVVANQTLARMLSPSGDVVAAVQFIPAASQLQLLHRIDQTIILQALSHCVDSVQSGNKPLGRFVNVSADLLRHRELVDEMLEVARDHCGSCSDLIGKVKPMVIEITERDLLLDISTVGKLLAPFIDFGFRLALDDFGSGYSSYQYLVDLPVSFIKIEGSLVKRIREPKVRAIVQGIQDTAETLGITTLAELVEDEETAAQLKRIGVHWGQGYLYGEPQLASAVQVGFPAAEMPRRPPPRSLPD